MLWCISYFFSGASNGVCNIAAGFTEIVVGCIVIVIIVCNFMICSIRAGFSNHGKRVRRSKENKIKQNEKCSLDTLFSIDFKNECANCDHYHITSNHRQRQLSDGNLFGFFTIVSYCSNVYIMDICMNRYCYLKYLSIFKC